SGGTGADPVEEPAEQGTARDAVPATSAALAVRRSGGEVPRGGGLITTAKLVRKHTERRCSCGGVRPRYPAVAGAAIRILAVCSPGGVGRGPHRPPHRAA